MPHAYRPGDAFDAVVLQDLFSGGTGDRTLRVVVESIGGAGAMGAVYFVAIHREHADPVRAVLKLALTYTDAMLAALGHEAAVLRNGAIDGVVQFLALLRMPDGARALLMERVEGSALDKILMRRRLHSSEAIALGTRLLDVLAQLHRDDATGVVHGDIKPANVIVPTRGDGSHDFARAVLIDFGVSRRRTRSDASTSATSSAFEGVGGGTPGYMPIGHLAEGASHRSDVFAVGAVLYEALTGRMPWTEPDDVTLSAIEMVLAMEAAMARSDPPRLHWRTLPPWQHTGAWNEFFRTVLARGGDAIPSAGVARARLARVARDRTFMVAVAVCVAVVLASAVAYATRVYCPAGESRCGGACVNLAESTEHCGACNRPAPDGQRCAAGVPVCPGAERHCGHACVDTANDLANCGACDNACSGGHICQRGACVLSCGDGSRPCAGRCVPTSTDLANCGACGHACADGWLCNGGACVQHCPRGLSKCDGTCRDYRTDRANCGACENACAPGHQCAGGRCTISCPAGETACDGTGCFALASDVAHCGACGTACAAGTVCSAGQCRTSCRADETNCHDSCRDTRTDRANCGACDVACAHGQVCVAGACTTECADGLQLCASACRDPHTDEENCGACGHVCANDRVCRAGACVCPAGLADCHGACVDTRNDPARCGCDHACAAGQTCVEGACQTACSAGLTVCGEHCRDVRDDPENCGMCGVHCAGGEACRNGACALACGPGSTACGDHCVDTASDGAHCGACGHACADDARCVNGSCREVRRAVPVVTPDAPVTGTVRDE